MFKALGLNKKQARASDSQIAKHQEQQTVRDQWRQDAQSMLGILSKLQQSYGAHKGDFALGRYEGLKAMIKGAISDFHVSLAEIQGRTQEKYGDKAKAYAAMKGSSKPGEGAVGKKTGALSSLKQNAQTFSAKQDEQNELTAKDVEEDLPKFRREVLQYKQDYKEAKAKLEKLTNDYENSKKLSPPQRYNELKIMIKTATRPS